MKPQKLGKILDTVLILLAVTGVLLFFVAIPVFGKDLERLNPDYKGAFVPWLILTMTVAFAYFYVLFHGHRIFTSIGREKYFTEENSEHLKKIAYAAGIESAVFLLGNIAFMILGINHPGVFLLCLVAVALGITLTVFAYSLSSLVLKAKKLQEDNDLTI